MFNCTFPFSQKALYSFECNDWRDSNNSALALPREGSYYHLGPFLNISNKEECEALCVAEVRNETGFYYGEYEGTLMEGKGACFFDLFYPPTCWWINGNQESTKCGLTSCGPAFGANCTIDFKSNGEFIIFVEGFALHFANFNTMKMRESLIP